MSEIHDIVDARLAILADMDKAPRDTRVTARHKAKRRELLTVLGETLHAHDAYSLMRATCDGLSFEDSNLICVGWDARERARREG